jgi:hypothetical protein
LKNGRPLEPPRESRMTTMIYPWVEEDGRKPHPMIFSPAFETRD